MECLPWELVLVKSDTLPHCFLGYRVVWCMVNFGSPLVPWLLLSRNRRLPLLRTEQLGKLLADGNRKPDLSKVNDDISLQMGACNCSLCLPSGHVVMARGSIHLYNWSQSDYAITVIADSNHFHILLNEGLFYIKPNYTSLTKVFEIRGFRLGENILIR